LTQALKSLHPPTKTAQFWVAVGHVHTGSWVFCEFLGRVCLASSCLLLLAGTRNPISALGQIPIMYVRQVLRKGNKHIKVVVKPPLFYMLRILFLFNNRLSF